MSKYTKYSAYAWMIGAIFYGITNYDSLSKIDLLIVIGLMSVGQGLYNEYLLRKQQEVVA